MASSNDRPNHPPDLDASPLFWLALLRSARNSGDRLLEGHARRKLASLGVRVVFDSEGVADDRE
jgi:hypothetical protein